MSDEQNCQNCAHLIDVPVMTQALRYIYNYGTDGEIAADKALEMEPCLTYARQVWVAIRTIVAIDRCTPTPTQP
jgi:hypothetical protein